MPPTPDLLDQIQAFSVLARRTIKLGMGLSPWGGDTGMATQGVVLHYSVSTDLAGTVRWFCDPEQKANLSAHLVLGRGKESWHNQVAAEAKTPLVAAMPCTPIACREVGQMAWHAGWANSCFGIEMIGAGLLTQGAGNRWLMGMDMAGQAYKGLDQPVRAGRYYFQPQTQAQVDAVVQVVRALRRRFPGILPEMILGHEHVQSVRTLSEPNVDKRDAGIGFPYAYVRRMVDAGQVPITHTPFPEPRDTGLVTRFAFDFDATMRAGILVGQLAALGYGPLPEPRQASASVFNTAPGSTIVKVFQRMAGLTVDGQIGPKTAQALVWRLTDRGLVPPAEGLAPIA